MQSLSILLSLILACGTSAAPTVGPNCDPETRYTVTSKNLDVLGTHPVVVPMTCENGGGSQCTLGASYTYTVSWSVNVGLNLNLGSKEIGSSAGLSAGYSYGDAKGTGDSANFPCPTGGGWYCAILVTPRVALISGEQTQVKCASPSKTNPYTVEYPIIKGGLPNVVASLCICPNGPDTTKAGHPPVCPQNC